MTKQLSSQNNDLFEQRRSELLKRTAPLADRMRPRTLEEYIGQQHIIGEGRLLRRAIQIDQLSSVIFYGPPGTGKTTLARIIANTTKAQFLSINAVLSGVKEIRESIDTAQKALSLYGRKTILFIDEVHRFNKAQQDALLPHVENGIIILIGATTENPYFEVNKALVSRSRIFQLLQLNDDNLHAIAHQALKDSERGYGKRVISIDTDALNHLVKVSNGDARGVLNALELAIETTSPSENGELHITRSIAEESIQQRAVLYDKDGDAHYDTISAFIKSIRGSDPDAALYWMAKMIYAGEDPRFIFRRMLVLACEDIGLADPHALGMVINAAQAFDYVGLPEGRYHLAHACLYLATAPKSNSSMAFFDALNTVSQEASDDVPDHLRDGNRDKEALGHGAGYLYPHAYRDHWVAQQYLPSSLQGKLFYQPSTLGYECEIGERVARFREAQLEAMIDDDMSSPLHTSSNERGPNPSQTQWLERSMGSRGVQLGKIRELILKWSDLKKNDVVLDLNARTGLLTFEALRQVTQGGVWSLTFDQNAFTTLQSIATRLDTLMQPQILHTTIDTFDKEIQNRANNNLRFDAIIGRGLLLTHSNKIQIIEKIIPMVQINGRIVIAESVPSEGQHLYELLDVTSLDSKIAEEFKVIEHEVFNASDDPLVNWTAQTITEDLQRLENIEIKTQTFEDFSKRRVKPADIDFWFRNDPVSKRRSLGDRITAVLGENTRDILQKEFHRQLDNKEVSWKTVTILIRLTRNTDI